MAAYVVGSVTEFPENTHRIVKIRSVEIGVFNVHGTFYALPSVCPHQFGPLCEGKVNGTMMCSATTDWKRQWARDGEILVCPWHGWQFDITTGQALSRSQIRLRTYPVTIEDGNIVVTLS